MISSLIKKLTLLLRLGSIMTKSMRKSLKSIIKYNNNLQSFECYNPEFHKCSTKKKYNLKKLTVYTGKNTIDCFWIIIKIVTPIPIAKLKISIDNLTIGLIINNIYKKYSIIKTSLTQSLISNTHKIHPLIPPKIHQNHSENLNHQSHKS